MSISHQFKTVVFGIVFTGMCLYSQSVSPNPMQWHKVTITYTSEDVYSETGTPNPFTDRRLDVVFTKGAVSYRVPGFFAADGDAANTGANSGKIWKCHFAPPEAGVWNFKGSFYHGTNIHAETNPGNPTKTFEGNLTVAINSKTPSDRDYRYRGWLEYVGGHYLQFKGSKEYFLKQGPDSPENLFSFKDFDGDFKTDGKDDNKVKQWAAHVADWKTGDPSWAGGKGKGLIGAINYLASEGLNAFSFLVMNINGDDKNVFPYINYTTYDRIDVSRMEQWDIVLDHGTKMGFFYDMKTQEAENQNLLDKGEIGIHRKLFLRELIARFGHNPGLSWNLGEENGVWSDLTIAGGTAQSSAQRAAMAQYLYDNDPYRHHIVLHNGQNANDMFGNQSKLTGWSLQTFNSDYNDVYSNLKSNLAKSVAANRPWAIASDESGGASIGLRLDSDPQNGHENARKNALWASYMAGGFGNQWYFGYQIAHSDLTCEDFRSRDKFWDYARYSLEFFKNNHIPIHEMKNAETKVGTNAWALAKEGQIYVIYLKNGGTTDLDVGTTAVNLDVKWYNPRTGGALLNGSKTALTGSGKISIGEAPSDKTQDWVVLIGSKNITSLPSRGNQSEFPRESLKIYSLNQKILKGNFTAEYPETSIDLNLVNIQGQVLKSQQIFSTNGQFQIEWNLADGVPGVYLVRVKTSNGSYQKKINLY